MRPLSFLMAPISHHHNEIVQPVLERESASKLTRTVATALGSQWQSGSMANSTNLRKRGKALVLPKRDNAGENSSQAE